MEYISDVSKYQNHNMVWKILRREVKLTCTLKKEKNHNDGKHILIQLETFQMFHNINS